MATELQVIRKFMDALVKSTKTNTSAVLNEAMYKASDGRYSSFESIVKAFKEDAEKYAIGKSKSEQKKWLASRCGIIMDNDDTGAITGSDAGGAYTKTSHNVVDERGNAGSTVLYSSKTVDKITFELEKEIRLYTDTEKSILANMENVWLPAAMTLVQSTYGYYIPTNKITLGFSYNASDPYLAVAGYNFQNGKKNYYITINATKFSKLKIDEDGSVGNDDSYKLDRILAHELTHSYEQTIENNAKPGNYNVIPCFVHEGLAELTQGADDFRYGQIYQVLNDKSTFDDTFKLLPDKQSKISGEQYASAYMFMRYFARQLATESVPKLSDSDYLPYQFYYTNNKTEIHVRDYGNYTEALDLRKYPSTIKKIDISNARYSGLKVIGSDHDDVIYAPTEGQASITPGKGNDYIYNSNYAADWNWEKDYYFGNDDGTNIIDGMTFNSIIYLKSGIVDGVSYNNGTMRIWSGNTDIIVKNMHTHLYNDTYGFAIVDSYNVKKDYLNKVDDGKVYTLDSNKNRESLSQMNFNEKFFYSLDNKKVRLTSHFSGTVDLSKYASTVTTVNASDVTSDLTLTNNSKSATIWLGKGKNTIVYGKGSGHDATIYNYTSSKDKIVSKSGSSLTVAGADSRDVYLGFNATGSKSYSDRIILKGMYGQTFKYNGINTQVLNSRVSETLTFGKGMGEKVIYNFKSNDLLKAKSGSALTVAGSDSHDVYLGFNTAGSKSYTDRIILRGMYGQTFKYNGINTQVLNSRVSETLTFGKGMGEEVIYNFKSNDRLNAKKGSALTVAGSDSHDVYLGFNTAGSTSYTDRIILKGMYGQTFKYNGINTQVLNSRVSETLTFGKGMGEKVIYNFKSNDRLNAKSGSALTVAGSDSHDVYLGFNTAGSTSYTDRIILKGMYGQTFKYNGINTQVLNSRVSETVTFGKGMGEEVIYNFKSDDRIKTKSGSSLVGVGISGDDVSLRYSNSDTLKLVGMAGQVFLLDGRYSMIQDVGGTAKLLTFTSSSMASSKNSLNYLSSVQSVSAPISSISMTSDIAPTYQKTKLAYAH